jgi:hypothetical protein
MARNLTTAPLAAAVLAAAALATGGPAVAQEDQEYDHYSQEAEEGTQASSSANTHITTRNIVDMVGRRAAALARGGVAVEQAGLDAAGRLTGLAGGDGAEWYAGRLALWADASGSFFDDATPVDDFDGHQYSVMVGADYRYNDRVMAGVGLGYEGVRVDFDSARERDVDYLTATVYGAWLATDTISLNALGSYGLGLNEATALIPAGEENDYLSHRFITAVNAAYSNLFGNVTTFGQVGVSYSHEAFEAYDTSLGATVDPDDTDLAQLYGMGDVGYLMEAGADSTVEPYVSARLEYDVVRDGSNDRFGAVLGGGLRMQLEQSVSLDAFGNTEVARSNEGSTSFGLNVRLQF